MSRRRARRCPGLCKLTDFGLSIDTRLQRTVSRVGTQQFMARYTPPRLAAWEPRHTRRARPSPRARQAPEIARLEGTREERAASGRAFYDRAADVWSLGCLAFELLVGGALFEAGSAHTEGTIASIRARALNALGISAAARTFIQARTRSGAMSLRQRRCPSGHSRSKQGAQSSAGT